MSIPGLYILEIANSHPTISGFKHGLKGFLINLFKSLIQNSKLFYIIWEMLFNSFMRWRALASQLLFTLVKIIKEGGLFFFVFDGPEDGELCKIHHKLCGDPVMAVHLTI